MPQAKHCLVVVLWQKSGSYCLHAELLWMLPLLRLLLQLLVAAGDSLSVAQCCTGHTVCCRLGWPSRGGLSHLSFEGHWSRCAGMGAKQFAFIQKCILWKRDFLYSTIPGSVQALYQLLYSLVLSTRSMHLWVQLCLAESAGLLDAVQRGVMLCKWRDSPEQHLGGSALHFRGCLKCCTEWGHRSGNSGWGMCVITLGSWT